MLLLGLGPSSPHPLLFHFPTDFATQPFPFVESQQRTGQRQVGQRLRRNREENDAHVWSRGEGEGKTCPVANGRGDGKVIVIFLSVSSLTFPILFFFALTDIIFALLVLRRYVLYMLVSVLLILL